MARRNPGDRPGFRAFGGAPLSALDYALRDLHGVEGRTLAEVVGAREQQQLVVVALGPADPADEHVVDPGGLEGARVDLVGRIVPDLHALPGLEDGAGL